MFAKLQAKFTPLRNSQLEEETGKKLQYKTTNWTATKIKCPKSSQVGFFGTLSKAGGSAYVGEGGERWPSVSVPQR